MTSQIPVPIPIPARGINAFLMERLDSITPY
jgi:hypothetical protein